VASDGRSEAALTLDLCVYAMLPPALPVTLPGVAPDGVSALLFLGQVELVASSFRHIHTET
jgi:hypothetical protein